MNGHDTITITDTGGYRPVCLDCDWHGPVAAAPRAAAFAAEHTHKTAGTWRPAR